MDIVFTQLLATLLALWWPFCRVLALLSAAPVLGDNLVPVPVRVLLALVLAVVLLPVAQPAHPISPFSVAGLVATCEQVVIGLVIGLAFHLCMAVITVLGYLVSSQMGLSMATMNDPMNGSSSDVVTTLLYMLSILVFFAIDGHLVFNNVMGASFRAWPVGGGLPAAVLSTLPLQLAWVFSAALLLAVPVVFATLGVQVGFGFLNRIAPAFNLFSLGFSLTTLFGLFMLSQWVRFVPEHFVRLLSRVLDMLAQAMRP